MNRWFIGPAANCLSFKTSARPKLSTPLYCARGATNTSFFLTELSQLIRSHCSCFPPDTLGVRIDVFLPDVNPVRSCSSPPFPNRNILTEGAIMPELELSARGAPLAQHNDDIVQLIVT